MIQTGYRRNAAISGWRHFNVRAFFLTPRCARLLFALVFRSFAAPHSPVRDSENRLPGREKEPTPAVRKPSEETHT
jgi:hypothetical protein